ncbi:MAG: hypothetical protein J6Q81_05835, partial [Lentisphaeria bacterium]|nr:hypothetical protein [Lentisphaeria bacterium]
KFDSPGWELFHQFADLDREETISGRFASALAMYLKKYQLEKVADKSIFKQIIVADFAHVCKNQSNKDIPEKFKDLAEFYLDELENNSKLSLAEFTQLFLSATFLIRKGDDK